MDLVHFFAISDYLGGYYIYLLSHIIMLIVYILIFFWMIKKRRSRWRLFYFYVLFFISYYIIMIFGDFFVMITKKGLDGCMYELGGIMIIIFLPFLLSLSFFDDSSYWLQLQVDLVNDKKEILFDESKYILSDDEYNKNNANNSPIITSPSSKDYVRGNSVSDITEYSVTATVTTTTQSEQNNRIQRESVWLNKLKESVGRFDKNCDFNRIRDQLSMVVKIIPEKDLIFDEVPTGFGAFSSVKKAKYKIKIKNNINTINVAVKTLYAFDDKNYKYVVNFMREAYLSQRLKHKNIVHFMGVVVNPPNLSLVYEYMKFGCLTDYLQKNKIKLLQQKKYLQYYNQVSLKTRVQFALDAARGIKKIHDFNVIHRDINGRNLLVTKYTKNIYNNNNNNNNKDNNGNSKDRLIVKVCDFGTCRQINPKRLRSSMAYSSFNSSIYTSPAQQILQVNQMDRNPIPLTNPTIQMTVGIGTPAYMAPEILKNMDFETRMTAINVRKHIEYDFAVDVFSFGGVLFEIMASKDLYENIENGKGVQSFVLSGKREKIPKYALDILKVPQTYIKLMYQCWQTNPFKRPTFKEIAVQLHQILKQIKHNTS